MKKIFLICFVLCLLNTTLFAGDSQIKINGLCPILNPGDTHQLTADYNGSVEWVSEDSSIATVDQTGMVTAIAEGKTTIKALDENDPSIFDTIKVNVNGEKSTFYLKSDYSVEYYNTIYVGKTYKIDLNDVYYGGYQYTLQSYAFWNYDESKWQSSTDYIDHWQSGDYLYLKALKNGKTVLALQSTRGSNTLTEYYYITVTGKVIPVTAVAIKAYINGSLTNISKKTVTINKGNYSNLYGGILPTNATNKTLTWTTSNSSVIKLESQGSYMKATAVGVGTAKITIKSNNGKTNYCYIKVPQPDIPVKLVAIKAYIDGTLTNISKKTVSLGYNGDSAQLYSSVLPETATNKSVTWESSDPSIVTVSSTGKITVVGNGKAEITVRTSNDIINYINVVTYSSGITGVKALINGKLVNVPSTISAESTLQLVVVRSSYFIGSKPASVSWSSSNSRVASVNSNGLVRFLSSGAVKITCKISSEKSIYFYIRVY